MKTTLLPLLLIAGALNAQPSGPLPGPYQAPFYHPQNPQPSSKIWGGQWIIEQGGTWYWFYDSFGNDNVPLHALTSKDGVFWREAGPAFEADADLKGPRTIINPELYRLDDGRVVMAYTVSGVLRFAATRDMKTWERFGREAELSVKKNPQWAQWYQQLLTPVSYRHPDGGWFHLVYATSPGIVGMGYARSQDGIHYDIKPPIRIDGVPNDRFDEHPTFGKGLELGGLTKIGDKYFMVGGGRQGDIIVSAGKPEGPYQPTPLNHALPRGPDGLFMFPRFYNDVPDGPLVTHTLWSKIDGKRAYRTEPLKRVVREGDSVWFKWWDKNDKLKSKAVVLEVLPGKTNGAARSFLLPGIGDQCHVIETSLPLKGIKPERNFAAAAKVTANNEHRFPEPARNAEDYLAAQHAIDGHDERSWIAEFLGILHLQRMGEEKFLAEIKSRQTDSQLVLDLGSDQPVGRVDARWTRSPGLGLTAFTPDLMSQTQLQLSADGKDWGPAIPVSRMDKNGFAWENIGRRARYVRIILPALGTIYPKLANLAGKEKPRSPTAPKKRSALPPFCLTGLAEVRVYEKPAWTVGSASDLPGIGIECEGDENEVILVEPNGIVHYGSVSKSRPGHFQLRESRNIDRDFGETASLRLVQQGDLFELYVNDYFIMVTQLRSAPTGKITLLKAGGNPSLRVWEAMPPGG